LLDLNPIIPPKPLPTCCIILDIAEAVLEALTKLPLNVFCTSLANSSINFISSPSNNSSSKSLFFCFKVFQLLKKDCELNLPFLLESLTNFSQEAVLND
jgi:hypothetical protein